MTADLIDPLLQLLRRLEAANAAYDTAAENDVPEEETDRLFAACTRAQDAIQERDPPATTAAGAIAALDYVLADQALWRDPDQYAGERFLRQLIAAARDFIARTSAGKGE